MAQSGQALGAADWREDLRASKTQPCLVMDSIPELAQHLGLSETEGLWVPTFTNVFSLDCLSIPQSS